jgi:hypothetical protein
LIGLVIAAVAACTSAALWYTPPVVEVAFHDPPPQPISRTGLALPEDERKYLWELEHHHNVLQEFGFRALCEALRDADRKGIERQLAAEFTAEILDQPHESSLQQPAITLVRQTKGEGPNRIFDRAAFVDWLVEQRQRFGKPPKVKFDVMLMTPPSHNEFEGRWRIKCLLRLWGEDVSSGPLDVTARAALQVERPTKKRLAEPGWCLHCALEQLTVVSSSHVLFADVTAQRGIQAGIFHDNWTHNTKRINTGGVHACDYNRDGCVDLLVTDMSTQKLYKGLREGGFIDVTADVGLANIPAESWATIAFLDFDNDGWEDLVLRQSLYRNIQGNHFQDVAANSNIRTFISPNQMLTGFVPGDFDRDGRVDLYVTSAQSPTGSWLESRAPFGAKNRLLRNKGDGSFEDVTAATNTDGGGLSTFTAAWLDYNQDNWPDLFAINEFGNGLLFENQGGQTFRPRPLADRPIDFGSMGLSAGDVNNDGAIDLYLSNMYSKAGSRVIGNLSPGHYPDPVMAQIRALVAGSELYLNRAGNGFEPLGKAFQVHGVGWSWGSALADLNNDGWLDIYATAGFMSRDRNKPDG